MSAWGKKPSLAIRQAGPAPAASRQTSTGSAASMNSTTSMNSMSSGMMGSNRRTSLNSGSGDNTNRRLSHGSDSGRGGGRFGRSNIVGSNTGNYGGGNHGGGNHGGGNYGGGNHGGGNHNHGGGNHNHGGGNHGGGNHRNNRKNNRPKHDVLQLNLQLLKPGDGKTLLQTSVMRRTTDHLLSLRLNYLDPPADEWDPPAHCSWSNEEERLEEIAKIAQASRQGGDVTENKKHRRGSVKETAPPIEDCKPLEVNNDTRWKSKAFKKGEDEEKEEELSDDEILKKALLILNKLSLTKFEKLSSEFVATGIDRNKITMEGAVNIVVDKAQSEPHFSSMYAQLCFKLSKKATVLGDVNRKVFRKLLLTRCQKEFEENQAAKIAAAVEGLTDEEEIAYKTGLVKRAYLGHIRFIGELYKGDMIKLEIMLWCLKNLLEDYDEERVECFTKLITTIGYPLEQQSSILAQTGKGGPQKQLHSCWKKVLSMIYGGQVSNRIKFMLLDLVEMRDKGWVTRRKEETAKTLDQVHREVEMEERKAQEKSRRHSTSNRNDRGDRNERLLRRSSSMNHHIPPNKPAPPVIDSDGFTTIMPTARSSSNLMRATSDATATNTSKMRRAQSTNAMGGGMMPTNFRLLTNANSSSNSASSNQPPRGPVRSKSMVMDPALIAKASNPAQKRLSRKEIQSKVQNLLKEFFVVGDTDDALLSFEELVRTAVDDNHRKELTKLIVESSLLLVLERKLEDVEKTLNLLLTATARSPSILSPPDFVAGFSDPLEFLSDIEIDAPKAGEHLVFFLSRLCKAKLVELEPLLLGAPEYFLSDGKPAHLAIRVLLSIGEEITDDHLGLVEKLMTDRDKEDFTSPKAILESLQK